jgi:hypothetical protein
MIFSLLETADFLMLLKPSGDGYSLLCSKKQPPRHRRRGKGRRGKEGMGTEKKGEMTI